MQFLDFAQDDVLVKSPILAQYILTNIAAVGEVVSILSHMAAADEERRADDQPLGLELLGQRADQDRVSFRAMNMPAHFEM